MKVWEVRGRQPSAPAPTPALQLFHRPPGDHAGPSDGQGAGVSLQTQGQAGRWVPLVPLCSVIELKHVSGGGLSSLCADCCVEDKNTQPSAEGGGGGAGLWSGVSRRVCWFAADKWVSHHP